LVRGHSLMHALLTMGSKIHNLN